MLSEFIRLFNGKKAHWDDVHGPQCTDLARWWIDWLGLEQLKKITSAAQLWTVPTPDCYERIPYAPGLFPAAGSLIIWDYKIGPNGHIAITTEDCTPEYPVAFSQNYPGGTATGIVKFKNYNGVLGWYYPKILASSAAAPESLKLDEAAATFRKEMNAAIEKFMLAASNR